MKEMLAELDKGYKADATSNTSIVCTPCVHDITVILYMMEYG